jgi:ribosomal protein S18 acetylase RimI-like enzyme
MMAEIELPGGLTWRHATRDDIQAITDLIAACEFADDGEAEIDPDDVAFTFDRANARADDAIVVFHEDRLVAWGDVWKERAEGDVHPDHRGRGIGARVLAWTESRARETGQTAVRQVVTDANTRAAGLFRSHGYEVGHISWILQVSFEEGDPPPVEIPPGITIRPYRDDDAPAAYRVIEDAFNEWPGRQPSTFEEWAPFGIGHRSFAPHLSRLAFDGDELVGTALAIDYANADEGWIQQVATKATHRHRGIARALLHEVFEAFHERGKRRCGLSTDSRTGALTLYERVGMHVRRSYTSYRKQLTP